jgi:hypothetical protein
MTAGHRQHAVATADRLRKTIAEDATSSQLMERAGLLTADSDRPAVRIKLECYHALEAKIADARPKLAELEEQFRHREVAASAETPNPRRKVPKAVFDALMYMEMRWFSEHATNRQPAASSSRLHTDSGSVSSTHRWGCVSFSTAREQGEKRQETGDPDSSQQLPDPEEVEIRYNRAQQKFDDEANCKIELDTRRETSGQIREPARERRNRKTTEKGLEHLKRKEVREQVSKRHGPKASQERGTGEFFFTGASAGTSCRGGRQRSRGLKLFWTVSG